jgi:hypothetical protein
LSEKYFVLSQMTLTLRYFNEDAMALSEAGNKLLGL